MKQEHCPICNDPDVCVVDVGHVKEARFIATCNNCYDGAPDADYPIGYGETEEAAIEHWREVVSEWED